MSETYKKWLNVLKPGKLYLYYDEIAITFQFCTNISYVYNAL